MGKIPDSTIFLTLAQKYSQNPSDVENWEQFFFNRAVLMLEAENLCHEEMMKKNKR